jgi:hypothetical protein
MQGNARWAEPPLVSAIGLLDWRIGLRLFEALKRHAHRCIGLESIASPQQGRSGGKRTKDFAHFCLHYIGASPCTFVENCQAFALDRKNDIARAAHLARTGCTAL